MAIRNFVKYLLNPKNRWLPLFLIFSVSAACVSIIAVHTYTDAPPLPSYVSSKNKTVFSKEDVLKGQAVFQKYDLMEYGIMFGDGGNRGPDFTAEALYQVSGYMNYYYQSLEISTINRELLNIGIAEQVKAEINSNQYIKNNNSVLLSAAQAFAAGIYHFKTVAENGLWNARSNLFIESRGFQTLAWLRMVGGALFTVGGVILLVWFIVSRRKGLKKAITEIKIQKFVYEKILA